MHRRSAGCWGASMVDDPTGDAVVTDAPQPQRDFVDPTTLLAWLDELAASSRSGAFSQRGWLASLGSATTLSPGGGLFGRSSAAARRLARDIRDGHDPADAIARRVADRPPHRPAALRLALSMLVRGDASAIDRLTSEIREDVDDRRYVTRCLDLPVLHIAFAAALCVGWMPGLYSQMVDMDLIPSRGAADAIGPAMGWVQDHRIGVWIGIAACAVAAWAIVRSTASWWVSNRDVDQARFCGWMASLVGSGASADRAIADAGEAVFAGPRTDVTAAIGDRLRRGHRRIDDADRMHFPPVVAAMLDRMVTRRNTDTLVEDLLQTEAWLVYRGRSRRRRRVKWFGRLLSAITVVGLTFWVVFGFAKPLSDQLVYLTAG